jgi:radical SAM protein with 4Fe4S-binding SPASM domain
MGVDAYARVIENIRQFVAERQARQATVPLLVPVFTKCRQNFAEMESWYDQWIRAVGSAVIRGPTDYAGQIPDASVADMAPPGRKPCARLASRITILSDGSIVSCEEDVLGKQVLGRIGDDSLADVWSKRMGAFRADHREARWEKHPMCTTCREWHRP